MVTDGGGRRLLDPVEFQQYLDAAGEDFLILEQGARQDSVRLKFTGNYQGRVVIWDCRLVTLKADYKKLSASGNGRGGLRDYIEIGENGKQLIPLKVGLNIPRVDLPAIRKMIIMIRQYKKLAPGRQEFGGSYQAD